MRGPDRGRRSPPQQRNMDRRYPAPANRPPQPDRRRQRSTSPGRGRSPGFNKRFRGQEPYDAAPGRYERYDRDFETAYDDPPGQFPDQYPRRPAPPSPRGNGQKTYKAFMMTLPDNITPEEAQRQYDEYLTAFYGSRLKAHFQTIKDRPESRAKFDPRELEKGMKVRNEEAQQAAKEFAADLLAGKLNPNSSNFNQGESADAKDAAEEEADAEPMLEDGHPRATAPTLLWKSERVAADLKLSRQLIQKLDKEKGIISNPLIAADELDGATTEADAKEEVKHEQEAGKPAVATDDDSGKSDIKSDTADQPPGAAPLAAADVKMDIDAALPSKTEDGEPTTTNYKVEVKTSEKTAAVSDSQAGDAGAHEAVKEVKAEAQVEEGTAQSAEDGAVGKLDVHLTYLWRVHRLDYYLGGEFWNQCDRGRWESEKRLLRAPHPEEGEQAEPEQEKYETAQVKQRVDQRWTSRLASPDPIEVLLHKEEVEQKVDDWIEAQVIKHSDTKWGNNLSTKMFVGKDFVLKHIRTKHGEKVQEQKDQIYEQLYWENYENIETNEVELRKHHRREALRLAAEAAKDDDDTPPEYQHGSGVPGRLPMAEAEEAGGMDAVNGVQRSGSGAGRGGKGGRGQARGGRGRGMGGMRGPGLGMDGAMPHMGPGMMGTVPGQMLVLAPGAGPLGPFLHMPIQAGGPMDMGAQMGGHRGQRGPGRGARQGRGGFGGNIGGGRGYGGRGYFDLDAPENQRSVLDYGDL